MTRFLTLLAGITISQCAFAQQVNANLVPATTSKSINADRHHLNVGFSGVPHLQTMAPMLDIIWSNDISNCGDWTFGNGSNEAGAPWSGIDLNFECTLDGPTGFFNGWAGGASDGTAAPAMNSLTSANGLLLLDSDYYGSEAQYAANWIENSWVQTAAPIDLEINPYVAISFETRYRCWDNGGSDGSEKCFVEISRDGTTWPNLTQTYVTTWEDEGLVVYGTDTVQCRYEVFPESETGFETENPDYREFDITEAAGGQSEVWIRFRWVGTWGYSWEIDDINVVDIEENDTRIDSYLSYTNFQQTGMYENGAWAQSQLPESLSAGAKVYNFGWGTQENVVLGVEVNGSTSSSNIIETFPNAATDTLSSDYVVSEVGTYTVNYTLTSDNVDDNPQNNVASQHFEVTEYSYGRDNGVIFDTYGGDFEYACMPYYDIHNDAVIYGIDVAIMNGGEPGSPIRTFVIDLDDPSNLGADGFLAPPYDMLPLAESWTYLNADALNSGDGGVVWYTFEFEEPLQVTAGQTLGASFEYFGGAALTIAESSTNFDGTAAIYGPAASDGSYAWRGTDEMPMVRLNFDPNIEPTVSGGIAGCTDPQACNFDPVLGATLDDLSCLYFDALGVCGGDCSLDSNGDGVCDLLGCDALFFSEYVEGFGNNKALEIYNPTPQFVDLSDYQIERYANGATAAADNQKVTLSGLLAPQDVVVCVLDKQDPDGIDFEAPVWDELAARADLWLNPVYEENNAMYYNGNDALVLRQISSNAVLDVIGKVGEDPGSEGWAGLTNNHTLIRKFEVTGGDVNAIDDFLVLDEWDAIAWSDENILSNAIFDNLGVHDCICSAVTNPGCTDPSAFNFDPTADVDDGSCTYFEPSCAAIGAPEWEAFDLGLYAPAALLHTAGQSVTQEVVLHLPTSIEEAGTGTTYAVADWSGLEVMGMPAGLAFDNLIGSISGGSQTCLTYSGVPTTAGAYEVTLTGELFLSVFGNPVSAGMVEASLVITIEANGNAVLGCTYPHAMNFNPTATDDDGSCAFAGCTDPSAENFEPYASVDDGTCVTEPCVASCLGDLNNDGSIGSADLLTLLTTFGGDCE